MGCYGIGVTRVVLRRSSRTTTNAASYGLTLSPVPGGDSADEHAQILPRTRAAEKLYSELRAQGIEVLLDDRKSVRA